MFYVFLICFMIGFCMCSNQILQNDSKNAGGTVSMWNFVYESISVVFLLDLLLQFYVYDKRLFSSKPEY